MLKASLPIMARQLFCCKGQTHPLCRPWTLTAGVDFRKSVGLLHPTEKRKNANYGEQQIFQSFAHFPEMTRAK